MSNLMDKKMTTIFAQPGCIAQSVTCLTTDASSIPDRSHAFVEIDHEILSTVILLPSTDSFKKGFVSYKPKYDQAVLVNLLFKLALEKVCLK